MEDKKMLEFNPRAIAEAREKAGLTQKDLAKLLKCKTQFISSIELGHHKPNIKTVERVWKALKIVDPKHFFSEVS